MLKHGITGFIDPRKMPRDQNSFPPVEEADFKRACFNAMQQANGKVVEIIAPAVAPNFYRAVVTIGSDAFEILGHTIHRLIAFSAPIRGCFIVFIDCPELEPYFSQQGYEVLARAELMARPTMEALTLLGAAEIEQIKYWKAETNGEIAFNWFD